MNRLRNNKLALTVLEQHTRLKLSKAEGEDMKALHDESLGEILTVSTAGGFEEIVVATKELKGGPGRGYRSICYELGQLSDGIAQLTDRQLIVPSQGYVGGLLMNGDEPYAVFALSTHPDIINPNDPVQEAIATELGSQAFVGGYTFGKANRLVNFPKSEDSETYLAERGFTQGSDKNYWGDLIGATAFMPGRKLLELIESHAELRAQGPLEAIDAFRFSGIADRLAAYPSLFLGPSSSHAVTASALSVVRAGGTIS